MGSLVAGRPREDAIVQKLDVELSLFVYSINLVAAWIVLCTPG